MRQSCLRTSIPFHCIFLHSSRQSCLGFSPNLSQIVKAKMSPSSGLTMIQLEPIPNSVFRWNLPLFFSEYHLFNMSPHASWGWYSDSSFSLVQRGPGSFFFSVLIFINVSTKIKHQAYFVLVRYLILTLR